MSDPSPTQLLQRAADGDDDAAAALMPLVYEELRGLAATCFRRERTGHTLQPTALVHEAWARLIDLDTVEWNSRAQFFVLAAKAMRNILIDHARARDRAKRGGGWQRVTLDGVSADARADDGFDIERLSAALDRLAEHDAQKARLVELRFFGGLDEATAAETLGIARSTASEHWRMARAWLHRELKDDA